MADQLPGRWQARPVRTLTSNPWFAVLEQAVTRPDGSEVTYYTLDFPGPAVGVIVRRGDEYLLIRQHRFIVDEYVWAIPSGGVHAGESPEQAAVREVAEETGYRVGRLRHLLWYYPSYGCSNQRFELFLAEDPVAGPDPFDANEVMAVRWFSRAEVLELMWANGIVDGLSLTPLAFLLLQEATARAPDASSASR
jgi:ADP-ribose pyrophosphatase